MLPTIMGESGGSEKLVDGDVEQLGNRVQRGDGGLRFTVLQLRDERCGDTELTRDLTKGETRSFPSLAQSRTEVGNGVGAWPTDDGIRDHPYSS